jgi:ribonucleotide monophosphatase NagD (HAD superfamily)
VAEEGPEFSSSRALVIGDTLSSDMLFGKNAGYATLFVGTGVSKMEEIKEIVDKINGGDDDEELKKLVPDYCVTSLDEFYKKFSEVYKM